QAERLAGGAANEVRARRDRAGGEAVIAAEHERQRTVLERARAHLVEHLADACDLLDVLLGRVDRLLYLGDLRRKVAAIDDRAAERDDLIAKARDPHRRRPHVHAAPRAAEVKRHADDVDW